MRPCHLPPPPPFSSPGFTVLRDLTELVELWYDPMHPDPLESAIPEDRRFVREELDLEDEGEREWRVRTLSPWVVRIKLDSTMLTDKRVRLVRESACLNVSMSVCLSLPSRPS